MPSNGISEVLTDTAKDGLSGLLEEIALKGLTDASRIATDLPQFLADDDLIAPGAIPTRLIGRQACRTWARGGGPARNPGFDGLWGGLCEPYLASIGELPGDGSIGPLAAGGQCPGIAYRILATNQNGQTFNVGTRTGPITVVTGPNTNASQKELFIDGTPAGNPVAVYDSTVALERLDGLPDDCGDPPPEYDPAPVPPGLPPLAPTIPVRFPGIGPIDVGISFNPDGTLNVNLPEVGIEVNLPDPTDGEEGGGGAPTTGPGSAGEPQETGSGDLVSGVGGSAEGEAPEGSVLTGVKVDILTAPSSRARYTTEVDRGVVYCYMGGTEGLALEPTGALVRSGQFFPAQKDYFTRWQVRSRFGYSVRCTPFYRELEDNGAA